MAIESFLTGFLNQSTKNMEKRQERKDAFDMLAYQNALDTDKELKGIDRRIEGEKLIKGIESEAKNADALAKAAKKATMYYPEAKGAKLQSIIEGFMVDSDATFVNSGSGGVKALTGLEKQTYTQNQKVLSENGTQYSKTFDDNIEAAAQSDTTVPGLPDVRFNAENKGYSGTAKNVGRAVHSLVRQDRLLKDGTNDALGTPEFAIKLQEDSDGIANGVLAFTTPGKLTSNSDALPKFFNADGTPNAERTVTDNAAQNWDKIQSKFEDYLVTSGVAEGASSYGDVLKKLNAAGVLTPDERKTMAYVFNVKQINDARREAGEAPIAPFTRTADETWIIDPKTLDLVKQLQGGSSQAEEEKKKIVTGDASAPLGIRNNNPGNLRGNDEWQGKVGVGDNGFVQFDSPTSGLRALAINLKNQQSQYGLNSVEDIISKYAPSSENNTVAYIDRVSKALGVNPSDPLDLNNPTILQGLMQAIVQHENANQNPYSDDDFKQAINMAS